MSEGSGLPDGWVVTTRLRLVPIGPADRDDLVHGRRQDRWHAQFPREDDVDGATVSPTSGYWCSRYVVLGREAVGTIGFHGPPDEAGEVEVGFGLVPAVRGQGVATEALQALMDDLDRRHPEGVVVRGRTLPENAASLRVLAACGFTGLRGGDGEGHLVLARPARPTGTAPAAR
ncbi:MAG: GNAT family N-acetyltransferase [Nocardioides sp.]|nr:GNAT family N-acetyltransferase [Nocardioides sp.]